MNEIISTFLEELDPFWHFLIPVIVSGFLGCLLGVTLSCLFCKPRAGQPGPPPAAPAPSESPTVPGSDPRPQ